MRPLNSDTDERTCAESRFKYVGLKNLPSYRLNTVCCTVDGFKCRSHYVVGMIIIAKLYVFVSKAC